MVKQTILDSGPWIALPAPKDKHHTWAVEQFARWNSFVTCEAVLAEVCARLKFYRQDPIAAIEFVTSRALDVVFSLQPLG